MSWNPLRTWLQRRRDEAALVRNYSLLVDEALAAQRAGATTAEVALVVTGGHRRTLHATAARLDRDALEA